MGRLYFMLKNNAIKVVVAFLALLLGIFASLFGNIDNKQDNEVAMTLRDYLVNSFISELPEINKNLPHKIDNNTTLLSIEYFGNKVISRYELIGLNSDAASVENFSNKIKPILKKQTCMDGIKSKLLEVDVGFVEKYQDTKGAIFFEVAIDKSDCLQFDLPR